MSFVKARAAGSPSPRALLTSHLRVRGCGQDLTRGLSRAVWTETRLPRPASQVRSHVPNAHWPASGKWSSHSVAHGLTAAGGTETWRQAHSEDGCMGPMACAHAHTHMHTYIHTHTHACTYIHLFISTHPSHTHVHMYTHIRTYLCLHT